MTFLGRDSAAVPGSGLTASLSMEFAMLRRLGMGFRVNSGMTHSWPMMEEMVLLP